MRVFLEIRKKGEEELNIFGFETAFIRIDVTGKTDDEIILIANDIMTRYNLENVEAFKHICYHDENPSKPCENIKLEI